MQPVPCSLFAELRNVDSRQPLLIVVNLIGCSVKIWKYEGNEADILPKNTTNVISQNHQKMLVWDKDEVNKEGSKELTQDESQQEGC